MATEVWIVQGKNKVRLVDKRGVDITEQVYHSVKASLQPSDNVIGKVMLVDADGNDLGSLLRSFLEKELSP